MTGTTRSASTVLAWLLACVALGAGAASASTVEPLNLEQLTERAEVIFLGRCLHAEADQAGDGLATRLTFAVDEALKGDAGFAAADSGGHRVLHVLLAGGEADGIRQHIAGMPRFAPGAEVVLFLTEPDRFGRRWPVGLAQGGFRVHRDGDLPARVRRDFDGLRMLPAGAAARAATAQPAADGMALSQLLDEVRRLTGAASNPR